MDTIREQAEKIVSRTILHRNESDRNLYLKDRVKDLECEIESLKKEREELKLLYETKINNILTLAERKGYKAITLDSAWDSAMVEILDLESKLALAYETLRTIRSEKYHDDKCCCDDGSEPHCLNRICDQTLKQIEEKR